jgi:molybdopterin/thiamine biosynthesis adenylyltransferase
MIPRLKEFTRFAREAEVVFRPDLGMEWTLPDPEGQVRYLLDLLDGTRTVEAVHAEMQRCWPALSLSDVRGGIEALGEVGLVEDAGAPSGLTNLQRERYANNLNFFGGFATPHRTRFHFQERLLRAHVLLLGAGGVGCHLLTNLAGLGVGHVTFLDFDTIELRNLNRQFLYREADVGLSKLDRAADFARALNSNLRLTPVSRRVESAQDVAALLDGVDLVLAAIDEPEEEVLFWVNEACVRAGTPMVAGGVRVKRCMYYSVQPRLTGCLQCLEIAVRPVRQGTPLPGLGDVNRSIGPAVTLVSGLIGMECLRYLTGFAPPISGGKVWLVDLETGETQICHRWERRPGCPVCAVEPARVSGEEAALVS